MKADSESQTAILTKCFPLETAYLLETEYRVMTTGNILTKGLDEPANWVYLVSQLAFSGGWSSEPANAAFPAPAKILHGYV
jgi:hypothetical protein